MVRHIGFIMDGNRRFAKRLMLNPTKGHEFGREKLLEVFEWLQDVQIKESTFYAFSAQNFNRPTVEFNYLMKVFLDGITYLREQNIITKHQIGIRVIGDITKFPKDVQHALLALIDESKNYTTYITNFALGYGGREEITYAIKNIAKEVENGTLSASAITADTVTAHLQLQSEPDLIIRTGGEHRTSNFLPWQSTYSEWIFLEKMWPEFSKVDFTACLEEYNHRQRRFGT